MIKYKGVTFDSVRGVLCDCYFLDEDTTEEQWRECLQYVLPMQHNVLMPIKPGSQDTWIQFWIDSDEALTIDRMTYNANTVHKQARITVRFLGIEAEMWAKALHHLKNRDSVAEYFYQRCNGKNLEYIGSIIPMNVDYFGVGNTTIAFDVSFTVVYEEVMDLDWEPLEYISLAAGAMG
jgi:hypothetical protein